jgi:hypothetical protein
MAAQLEVRQRRLDAARRILGMAVGLAPKDKTFKAYIEMEFTMGARFGWRRLVDCVCWMAAAGGLCVLDGGGWWIVCVGWRRLVVWLVWLAAAGVWALGVLRHPRSGAWAGCLSGGGGGRAPVGAHATRLSPAPPPPHPCAGNIDRCRTLYEKYLEWAPSNCSAWTK